MRRLSKISENTKKFIITAIKLIENFQDAVASWKNDGGKDAGRTIIYIKRKFIAPIVTEGHALILQCERELEPKSRIQLSPNQIERLKKNQYYNAINKIYNILSPNSEFGYIHDISQRLPVTFTKGWLDNNPYKYTIFYSKKYLVSLVGYKKNCIASSTFPVKSKFVKVIIYRKTTNTLFGLISQEISDPFEIQHILMNPLISWRIKNNWRFKENE